jgi:meso-butanediol dehydrogenase/(S,S)-butanediol dehydrogenase/diacetyl reductase
MQKLEDNNMKLGRKVAIVTGAGAGIGEATAHLFATEGARVVCNSISESASHVVNEIIQNKGKATFVQGDVSDVDSAKRIVEAATDTYGQLDILVNNAGIVLPGRVDEMSLEEWDRTMAVNVRGVYLLSKYAVPYLRNTRGVIVNTSSVLALKGVKNRAAYSASKGAVLSLTKAMAADYMEDGIRVNCICPGTTDTPSLAHRLSQFPDPEEARKQFIARQPMGRLGTSQEIAEGILYLVLAQFATGISLSVDGGMTI